MDGTSRSGQGNRKILRIIIAADDHDMIDPLLDEISKRSIPEARQYLYTLNNPGRVDGQVGKRVGAPNLPGRCPGWLGLINRFRRQYSADLQELLVSLPWRICDPGRRARLRWSDTGENTARLVDLITYKVECTRSTTSPGEARRAQRELAGRAAPAGADHPAGGAPARGGAAR